MVRISPTTHAIADYATGALLLAAPGLTGARDPRARVLLRGVGATMVGQALVTDWDLGVLRRLPVRAHLAADAVGGSSLVASPWVLGLHRRGPGAWLPGLVVGLLEVGAAALTDAGEGSAAERGAAAVSGGDDAPAAPDPATGAPHAVRTPDVPGSPVEQPDQGPGPLATPAGDAPGAGAVEGLRPLDAPAPAETPGPSVPPAGGLGSTTEREELADATVPDAEGLGVAGQDPIDQLVAREEAAAAAEAAAVGGTPGADVGEAEDDPAMRPVYEAGGGEQEGFELAEAELVENASHGEGRANPASDAFAPEAESDRSTAEYGEPDQEVDAQDAGRTGD